MYRKDGAFHAETMTPADVPGAAARVPCGARVSRSDLLGLTKLKCLEAARGYPYPFDDDMENKNTSPKNQTLKFRRVSGNRPHRRVSLSTEVSTFILGYWFRRASPMTRWDG